MKANGNFSDASLERLHHLLRKSCVMSLSDAADLESPLSVGVMALGHYMRKIGKVQGYFPGGKHPMTTGSKMTPRNTQRDERRNIQAPKSEMTREALPWSNRLSVALIWP